MRLTPVALLTTALSMLVLAAPARATDRTFEGEAMTTAAPNRVVSDSAATGGHALELVSARPATRMVTTAAPAYWIAVRARGSGCLGPANVSVWVDGVERYFGAVGMAGYRDVEAPLPALARGTHAVELRLADDFRDFAGSGFGCRREVRVDRVTVYAPFADDSFRNRPLGSNAPLDKRSPRLVASLRRQVATRGTWVNTTTWSAPVYIVPRSQPPVRVDSPTWQVEQQLNGAPLPSDARPADPPANPPPGRPGPPGDANLVLYQPSTGKVWEFFRLRRSGASGRWVADWGGRMDRISSSPGYFTNHRAGLTFGASASRISLLGSLQTIAELQAGRIDHAVQLVLPNVTQGSFVWPAQASDASGRAAGPASVPEGTRFRLPASLDVDALGLPPYTRTLAKAIQRYGAVVCDRGGLVAFKAEDPVPTHTDPYTRGIYGGKWPDNGGLFARFPWRRLQVVAVPGRR